MMREDYHAASKIVNKKSHFVVELAAIMC